MSCSKKSWNGKVNQISLPENETGILHAVIIDSKGKVHIIGGDKFTRNDFYQSDDNGLSWTLSHIDYHSKAVYSITELHDTLFVGGYDGKIIQNVTDDNGNWQIGMEQSWWYSYTGLAFTDNSIGFAAANGGFQNGLILKFKTDYQILQIDSFPFAINDVCFVDNSLGFAVGYGAFLKTSDGGQTWTQLGLTDDNYRAMAVIDKDNIWAVGFNGTIAHLMEEGSIYDKVKNGQNPVGNTDRYLDIAFKGSEGFIVGEKGVVLHTKDQGATWEKMKKFTSEDLYGLAFSPFNDDVYFVGNNNTCFKFSP